MRAVSSGSSLKHSKWRPPSGERCRLMVGPTRTSTPLALASVARNRPSRSARSSSQLAAMQVGEGRLVEVWRSHTAAMLERSRSTRR
jgi:hypothetical protein